MTFTERDFALEGDRLSRARGGCEPFFGLFDLIAKEQGGEGITGDYLRGCCSGGDQN